MKWQKLKGTVKIPDLPRDQRSILKWCKAARECLIQLEGRLAPVGTGASVRPADPPPFYPVSVIEELDESGNPKSPRAFSVRLKRGFVVDRATDRGNSDPLSQILPKMEVDASWLDMDDEDAVISVEIGETVYCQYETDEFGVVKNDGSPDFNWPRIIAGTGETSTHYQPEDDVNLGVDGTWSIELLKIEADGSSYKVVTFHQSDIENYHELPTIENLGDGKEVFKQRDQDKYELLSLKGTETSEPGSSFTELDTLVEYDGGATLADATALKVRAFIEDSELGGSHPWKATENGDDTIDIAAGNVLKMVSEGGLSGDTTPQWVHLDKAVAYAGGTVTVPTGGGFIYGRIEFVETVIFQTPDPSDPVSLKTKRLDPSGTLTVEAAGSMPASGDQYVFLIAEVSLAGGVATVDNQVLTHNPQLHSYQCIFEA
jgi:hypothetical protein